MFVLSLYLFGLWVQEQSWIDITMYYKDTKIFHKVKTYICVYVAVCVCLWVFYAKWKTLDQDILLLSFLPLVFFIFAPPCPSTSAFYISAHQLSLLLSLYLTDDSFHIVLVPRIINRKRQMTKSIVQVVNKSRWWFRGTCWACFCLSTIEEKNHYIDTTRALTYEKIFRKWSFPKHRKFTLIFSPVLRLAQP